MIPKISVGISVYNERATIVNAIMSVRRADEIIIIDGKYPQIEGSLYSTDGTEEEVKSAIDAAVIPGEKIRYIKYSAEEEDKRSKYLTLATSDSLLVLDGDELFRSSWSDFEYLNAVIDEYWCLLCEMRQCVPLFAMAEVPRVINLKTADHYSKWNQIEYKRMPPQVAFLPVVIQHCWTKGGNMKRRRQQTELYQKYKKYEQGPDRRKEFFSQVPVMEVKRNG